MRDSCLGRQDQARRDALGSAATSEPLRLNTTKAHQAREARAVGREALESLAALVSKDVPDASAVRGWCYAHDQVCPALPEPSSSDALVISSLGFVCTSWSTMGCRQGWKEPQTLSATMTWFREVLAMRPHAIVAECTSLFDDGSIAAILQHSYDMTTFMLS